MSLSTDDVSADTPATVPMATPTSTATASVIATVTASPAATTTTKTTSTTAAAMKTTETEMKTVLLINGPNLNLLGYREPNIYGRTTLAEVEANLYSIVARINNSNNSNNDDDDDDGVDSNTPQPQPQQKQRRLQIQLQTFQSNSEGAIVDRIHQAFFDNLEVTAATTAAAAAAAQKTTTSASASTPTYTNAIIINPGAYTHTSIAIRDALVGADIRFVECHVSNVHAREPFRQHSYLSDKAEAVVAGLGVFGYVAALEYWVWKWRRPSHLP